MGAHKVVFQPTLRIVRSNFSIGLLLTALTLCIPGCAGKKISNISSGALLGHEAKILESVCQIGSQHTGVEGSVWMKAKSSEASGQFPADVQAEGLQRLRLVVTNLLGGTEAVITLNSDRYMIEVPNRPDKTMRGDSSWGGIPLQWAAVLFLGRVPCPSDLSQVVLSSDSKGDLAVEVPERLGRLSEKFIYHLRVFEGKPWPEALRWERAGVGGAPNTWVDFKFEDPDSGSGSPKKWEARSTVGEVRVKWKDRKIAIVR